MKAKWKPSKKWMTARMHMFSSEFWIKWVLEWFCFINVCMPVLVDGMSERVAKEWHTMPSKKWFHSLQIYHIRVHFKSFKRRHKVSGRTWHFKSGKNLSQKLLPCRPDEMMKWMGPGRWWKVEAVLRATLCWTMACNSPRRINELVRWVPVSKVHLHRPFKLGVG